MNASLLLAHKGQHRNNHGVVSWWHTQDGGYTLKQEKELLSLKDTNFAISSIIRNAHPEAQVLVAGIVGGSD